MIDLLYIIGVIVVVLGLAFGFNYLRKKGIVDKDTLNIADDLLTLTKIALRKSNNNTAKVEFAIYIIKNTIDFIGELDDLTLEQKKASAVEYILESLRNIDMEVDSEVEELVKIIASHAFDFVEKDKK